MSIPPAAPSSFEKLVKSLRLSPDQYLNSNALREWVQQNKGQKYVPQDVLDALGFDEESDL